MAEYFDDLFDENSENLENETPDLDQVLELAIRSNQLHLHTGLPCVVTAVKNNSFVDIQPLLKRKYRDGTLVMLPIIQNVPISHARGKDYWVKLPIAVGDTGYALFSERSLDAWSVNGGYVDPADSRLHDLTDAIFLPGLYPQSDIVPGNADDLVIHNGKAEILVKKPGTFQIKNASNELIDLLDQTLAQLKLLADTLSKDTTNTVFGPQQLNSFSTYTQIKTEVDSLDTKLKTLKG